MTSASPEEGAGTPPQIADTERLNQLEHTVHEALGHPLAPDLFAHLSSIQSRLWTIDRALDEMLENKEITPEDYLVRADDAMERAMKESATLLGPRIFSKIFGQAGARPKGSIVHTQFIAEPRGS